MRLLAALIFLVGILSGCGGGGSSVTSPYAGAWTGQAGFVVQGGSGSGSGALTTLVLTVDSKGRVTGTFDDNGATGTLGGSVTTGGTFTLSFNDPGSPDTATVARGPSSLSGSGWEGDLTVTSPDLLGETVLVALTRT